MANSLYTFLLQFIFENIIFLVISNISFLLKIVSSLVQNIQISFPSYGFQCSLLRSQNVGTKKAYPEQKTWHFLNLGKF